MNQYVGKRLGAYQLLEQIGQGGMATIYKAYQPSMDRYVAVKILPAHFTQDETFVARFTQEAHTLARLEHPFILPVHDYGEQDGITYLVMRYIEAGTLKDVIAQRAPLPMSETLRIMRQVGGALGHAHSQGVVHRDIKPTNVLIDRRGDAFLTDFGIAKLVAGAIQYTATGAIIGTPAYMSPEQGLGEPVDHRSDIYALGVVLYEMVTGRVPFEAETPLAVLLKHVNDPLPPPRQVKPDVPEAVERVILKAMAKSPADRFQTAEALVDALEKAAAGLPTESALPPAPLSLVKTVVSEPAVVAAPRKSVPWLPIAGGVATLAAVLIVALLVWPKLGGGKAQATPTMALVVAQATTNPPAGAALPPAVATSPALAAQPMPAGDLVVDNNDSGFTIEAGEWGECSRRGCGGVGYGDNFRYAEPGCTDCRARFDLTVAQAGEYDLWAWWPQGDDRATDTPFTVTSLAGSVTLSVDQRNDGSRWVRLGVFTLDAGETVSVGVAGSHTGFANADAVALAPAGAAAPTAGWTSFTNGNFVRALARQDDYLWAGGEGGLVRWDLSDGSYVKLGAGDGLAPGWVNDLLVDDDGNLWIATDAGINRFDGESWALFDEADGLDSAEVHTLFLDGDGGLWAGAAYGDRGLNYYADGAWGPPPLPPLPFEFPKPTAILEDEAGGLWVGLLDDGLAHFDGSAWQVLGSADGLPDDRVWDLLLSDDGELWASFERGVVRLDPQTGDWQTVSQLSDTAIYAMVQADDGGLWFAGDGAARYDPETGDWQRLEDLSEWTVLDIIEDERGLWFGTLGGGVFLYDGAEWHTWATDDPAGGNWVDYVLQDGSGALWFTHAGSGLSRYDPAADAWQTMGEAEGALDWPAAAVVDAAGQVWLSGYGELRWYDGSSWHSLAVEELAEDQAWEIDFAPDGSLWLRTETHRLLHHDPTTGATEVLADHPALETAYTVYVAPDGAVWVGGEAGLVRYDGESWSGPQAAGNAPQEYVDAIAAAPDGGLWVVGEGALYHLDDGQWSRFDSPDDSWISVLAVGPDGTVWVDSDRGLAHFDPLSGDWETFTVADGLVHPDVNAILVTPEGVVWVGTVGGISRYVPEE
jgi:ligand-binding sensor domain-containing protein/tRNA A-37 threonylcarbamoyl transferase component Bud32